MTLSDTAASNGGSLWSTLNRMWLDHGHTQDPDLALGPDGAETELDEAEGDSGNPDGA